MVSDPEGNQVSTQFTIEVTKVTLLNTGQDNTLIYTVGAMASFGVGLYLLLSKKKPE